MAQSQTQTQYAKRLAQHACAELTADARRAARAAAGLPRTDHRPVYVVAGRSAPTLHGSGYHYTTMSGRTIVRYPGAYGWRTQYQHSTRRVEVGVLWLARRGLASLGPVTA